MLQILIVDDGSDARWMTGDHLERYVDAEFPRRSWGQVVGIVMHLVFVSGVVSMWTYAALIKSFGVCVCRLR